MFGDGLYFTDTVVKALCYADAPPDDVTLLLSEVNVGRYRELPEAKHSLKKPPTGFDSVKGCGCYHPDERSVFCDEQRNAELATGELVRKESGCVTRAWENRDLKYNEFVVYNEKRVNIRYLVHLNRSQSQR